MQYACHMGIYTACDIIDCKFSTAATLHSTFMGYT